MASKSLHRTDLAYMAGLMDGEGSICIISHLAAPHQRNGKRYHRYVPSISICNTDKRMLEWVVAHFGGTITPVKRARDKLTKWKQTYYWRMSHRRAEKILLAINPFIVTKRKQLALFVSFMKQMGKNGRPGTPLSVLRRRKQMAEQMKRLNRTGPS